MKRDRIFLYKIIAIVCTSILCLVQLIHIQNIYKLEEKVYNVEEAKIIKKAYEESIVNDKLFPGAVHIIDSFIYRHLDTLEYLSRHNKAAFADLSKRITDSMFIRLSAANNIQPLLDAVIAQHKMNPDLQYALFVNHLSIAPEANVYVPLFTNTADNVHSTVPYLAHYGAKIGGTLSSYPPQSLVSNIKVSSTIAHSYRMEFSLYCDRPDRLTYILKKTLPQTSLSVFSIVAMLSIYFLTFANWVRQKKESEMKSDFINTISHEFQTPLTTIIIANKTIENENQQIRSPQLDALSSIIKRQSERLTVLVKQVIETSGEKPIRLELEEHVLNDELEEIISDYRINVDEENTHIVFSPHSGEQRVLLDKLHFTSIVLNMLDNSVKYNHKTEKEILLSTYLKNASTIALSIKDNGDGMSSKVKKRMFQKFYRNPSLVSSNKPGIGLGLYHTKKCIDAHQWSVEVHSKKDIGTEFIIYIPIATKHSNSDS